MFKVEHGIHKTFRPFCSAVIRRFVRPGVFNQPGKVSTFRHGFERYLYLEERKLEGEHGSSRLLGRPYNSDF